MRCLVTGASGHLGSYLVRRLLRDGHEVTGLVRRESDLWRLEDVPSRLQLIYGDLAAVDLMSGEIKAAAPDVVFHLAWFGVASPYRDDPRQVDCNLMGTVRLLRRAQEAGCRCWVGLGSQAEYGVCTGILHEDVPTHPVTLYGAVKLSAGLLTRQLCRLGGTRYVWLRLLATYGPKDDERHLIPSVIRQLLAGQRPSLTSGEQRWDYLYVEDGAEALYQAAFTPQVEGVFNLGSGEAHRVRDIVEQIRDMIDPSLPLGFGELPDQPLQLQADIARLKQATGWVPRVTLADGLRRTVEWQRQRTTK
jgi:nucleoside-diphosphate-sugar epimerase